VNPEKKEYVILNKPKDFVTLPRMSMEEGTVASLISVLPNPKLNRCR